VAVPAMYDRGLQCGHTLQGVSQGDQEVPRLAMWSHSSGCKPGRPGGTEAYNNDGHTIQGVSQGDQEVQRLTIIMVTLFRVRHCISQGDQRWSLNEGIGIL
jgi:hypothetical protein